LPKSGGSEPPLQAPLIYSSPIVQSIIIANSWEAIPPCGLAHKPKIDGRANRKLHAAQPISALQRLANKLYNAFDIPHRASQKDGHNALVLFIIVSRLKSDVLPVASYEDRFQAEKVISLCVFRAIDRSLQTTCPLMMKTGLK
jgi:hypothetical protein